MIEWVALAAFGAVAAAGVGWWVATARGRRLAAAESDALREQLAQRVDEVYSLQELSFVLSESLKPTRIAERITEYVTRFLPVDGVVVAFTAGGNDRLWIAAGQGSLAALANRDMPRADGGLLANAMQAGHLQLAEREHDADPPHLMRDTPVERAAVLPLQAHGVTVGALAVANRSDHPFSAADLRLLSTVATHTAIVVSNARFVDLVRAARDQWEATFNSLTEGIAVVDSAGRIRRANVGLASLLDVPETELEMLSLGDRLGPASDELRAFLDAAHSRKPAAPITLESEGLGRIFRITAAPMRGEADDPWAVVLVEDVTEEAALESQLIQNEKMAAVGQLVSGVAHELNNPLTSIAGLAELLLEHARLKVAEREHLRVIHEQADRAGRIVRNLLTFARKGPADVGPVDLNDIIRRTVTLVAYELRLREVTLDTDLDSTLPSLQGDRYQLQQVVLNLVTNAVQAVADNPAGQPRRVEVRTEGGAGEVVLRVADSGPGIPDDVFPQIFTPFFTTKTPGQGTGLGLSIVFRIVQGHGGTLTVERGSMGGPVFVVRLPARTAESTAGDPRESGPHEAAAGSDAAETPVVAHRHALLLDDDPGVRRMISVLLTRSDLTLEAARNAEHAVELLESRVYDLIIADARTAVSAGERFAEYLLRRWPGARATTILLTADVRPETHTWLKRLGCRYFIKPFRIGDLNEAATDVLARGRRGQS